ncbi:DeoR/GlpR family DNA-binding transcription regulator [Fictibacillus nanhaiensis]|uniref:DeoR/GlpR family DNA-binding transcription regulator n=1 Tax=Fictibacillus nanhaiensis TaxID=742169 RepID=UPI001C98AF9A|nr:DeoR/GlpR family DNA-binding transcription regulator [Fictibacillus nanhaiensis]MBY6035054.1 DeoR/GlpR family DNA-binding transcription regulator [Fictibacillus nanhaiensis]
MNLVSENRRMQIMSQLETNGKIFVTQLAESFHVTPETIRRDLDELEQQGSLKRVHGGAIKISSKHFEPPFVKRQSTNAIAKKKIGQKAASTIDDGDTIVLDAGTTTLELAKAIEGRKQLTVLTNSIAAANVLNDSLYTRRFEGSVILIGGTLNFSQQSISGSMALAFLGQYRVDKAYISCGGVSTDVVTDYDVEEAQISKKMVESAQTNYLLADHSKFDKHSFSVIAPLEKFQHIISDVPYMDKWNTSIDDKKINWIFAKEMVTIEG